MNLSLQVKYSRHEAAHKIEPLPGIYPPWMIGKNLRSIVHLEATGVPPPFCSLRTHTREKKLKVPPRGRSRVFVMLLGKGTK